MVVSDSVVSHVCTFVGVSVYEGTFWCVYLCTLLTPSTHSARTLRLRSLVCIDTFGILLSPLPWVSVGHLQQGSGPGCAW